MNPLDDQHKFELFAELLERLESGELPQEVLARAEMLDVELVEMLNLCSQLGSLATSPPVEDTAAALKRTRMRVLAAVPSNAPAPAPVPKRAAPPAPPPTPGLWERLQSLLSPPPVPAYAYAAVMAVLVFLFSFATALQVSAAALPGQLLYPLKLAREQVSLAITIDPQRRAEKQMMYRAERERETATLMELGIEVETSIEGIVGEPVDGYWRIGSFLVKVAEGEDLLVPGTWVYVTGRVEGRSLVDARVEPPRYQTPTPTPTPASVQAPLQPGSSLQSLPTDTPAPVTPKPTRRPRRKTPTPVRRTIRIHPKRTPTPTATPVVEILPTEPSPTSAPGASPEPTATFAPGQVVRLEGIITQVGETTFVVARIKVNYTRAEYNILPVVGAYVLVTGTVND
ncbi:MAG: hypothetical protein D6791_16220, partial [Chloroflexi bacterium]